MLSKTNRRKDYIYSICKNSEDIAVNTAFKSVELSDDEGLTEKLKGRNIICCGNVNDNEKVFKTEDGRFYFSICDGWGVANDTLYGITLGIFHDFGHSTAPKSAHAMCDIKPTYTTFGGALKYQAKKRHLDAVKEMLKRVSG
ncbi:MAG: hypothetical protein IJL87_02055 [Clostridia bacterium]|nr:hypothetical protein [Clostridia bacterium]